MLRAPSPSKQLKYALQGIIYVNLAFRAENCVTSAATELEEGNGNANAAVGKGHGAGDKHFWHFIFHICLLDFTSVCLCPCSHIFMTFCICWGPRATTTTTDCSLWLLLSLLLRFIVVINWEMRELLATSQRMHSEKCWPGGRVREGAGPA